MIEALKYDNVKNYFNPERVDLLTQVAKKTLIETAVSGAIFAATAVFITTGSGVVLLGASIAATILFNATVRIVLAELIYREAHDPSKIKKIAIKGLNFICPYTFSTVQTGSLDILVHETGHAIAAKALFTHANPKITIDPYSGGATNFFISGLTELGKKIGFRNADIAVTVAGSGLSVTVAAIAFAASYALQDNSPELSNYLLFSSIFNIANAAMYALSALWTPLTETSHDFVYLSLHGFHPILSAACIIAVPITIRLAIFAGYYIKEVLATPPIAVAA